MIVWNLATKRKEKEIMGGGIFGDDIRAMAVTPDGQRVVTRRQSSLTVTNIATGKDEIVIETAKSALTKSASITPDGKRVVTTGGNDGSVEMWNIETGKLEKSFKGHKYRVYAATATPDGKRVVTGGTIWIAP
jgi:WD40 repeat protein